MKAEQNEELKSKNIAENTEQITGEIIKPKPEEKKEEDRLYHLFNSRQHKLLPLLNNNSGRFEKITRSFVFALHKNKLAHLGELTLMEGFIKLCELDLEPSGSGKVYLSEKSGSLLDVQIGYQGYLELLWRKNLVANVFSNIVYEGDEFEVEYSNRTKFIHKPKFESDELKLTYAVVILKSGDVLLKVAKKKEIEESKSLSKGLYYKDGRENKNAPWIKFYDAMAQVVPLRKIAKTLGLAIRQEDEETETAQNSETEVVAS